MMHRQDLYGGGMSVVQGFYIIEFNCDTFFTRFLLVQLHIYIYIYMYNNLQ